MSQGQDAVPGYSLKSGKSGNLRRDVNQEADSRNFEANDSRSHRSNNSKEGMLQTKVSHTRQKAESPYNQMHLARSTSPPSSDFGDLNDREELPSKMT